MENRYTIRQYREGDDHGIVQLLEFAFNGWLDIDLDSTPSERWKWKYKDNPIGKIIVVAMDNEKIIGCAHTLLSRVKIRDRIITLGNGTDLAVHAEYRGRGLWKQMDALLTEIRVEDNVKISLSISPVPRVIKSLAKTFPRFPFDAFKHVRIRDLDLHFNMKRVKHAFVSKYAYLLFRLFNKLKTNIKNTHEKKNDYDVREISYFDESINNFWNDIKDQYDFVLVRSQDYLNWRYCDPRSGNYKIYVVEEDGSILGYSVLRINRFEKEYPVGYVVDLICDSKKHKVADALIAKAVKYFDTKNVNAIRTQIIKDHPYEEIFNKYGFINSQERINIFYKEYADIKVNNLSNSAPDRIHLVHGDYDWI